MQTFLPYPSFYQSAKVLDDTRLGNQRKEAKQILMVLLGETKHWKNPDAWKNHPAVLMWKRYEFALANYGAVCCEVWRDRGKVDNLMRYFVESIQLIYLDFDYLGYTRMPGWFSERKFFLSHQSNLIRKDPDFYGPLFPGVPDNLPYFWPSKEGY